MKTSTPLKFLSTLVILLISFFNSEAQINITLDQAAFDANKAIATPVQISVYLPRKGNQLQFMTKPQSSTLTDAVTGNTIRLNLLYYKAVLIKDPESAIITNNSVDLPWGSYAWHCQSPEDRGSNIGASWISNPLFAPGLSIPNLNQTPWKRGTYRTSIELLGLESYKDEWWGGKTHTVPLSIKPSSVDLIVSIPALLNIINPNTSLVNLEINNLNYFRTGYTATTPTEKSILNLQHTIPFSVKATSLMDMLTYNGKAGTNISRTPVNLIQYSIDAGNNNKSSLFNLSATGTPYLLNNIPKGNKTTLTASYNVSSENLKKAFMWEGTYEVNNGIKFIMDESVSNGSQGQSTATTISAFKVTVSDLKEFILKDKEINLNFKTATDYMNGVKVTIPAHLRTSSTSPFNLTVKAETATFSLDGAASELPCSILQLEPSPGKSDIQQLSVSTTAQSLISNALPVIDQDIDVTYHIPPSPLLVPARKGAYSLKLTYSMETL